MYTVDKALDILTNASPKIVKDKQYWLDNYNKLKSVDSLIIQMANYIEPFKEDKVEEDKKVYYTETPNGTRQIFMNPSQLKIDVYPKMVGVNTFTKYKFASNGSFFGGNPCYSTTPLIVNGEILRWGSNYGKQQSCIIIYKDNKVEMRKLNSVADLGNKLYSVKNLIGGIGLVNKDDSTFKYNPESEGYVGSILSGVTRKCHKSAIGYIKATNELVLLTRPYIYHKSSTQYDLLDLVNDCQWDYGISTDGSGSSFMIADGKYTLKGDGRKIYSVLYAE